MQILDGTLPWPDRFARLEALVVDHADGWDLVQAGPRSDCDAPNAICPPLPESEVGYRSFLIDWAADAETETHGHPSVMFVVPISARLEAVEYTMVGGRPKALHTRTYGPGESMTGHANNDRHDNFMHRLRCVEPGWSLHIYSDWGGRGPRFDAEGHRIATPSLPRNPL
ncbi:MAG: hypothetical protein CL927_10390 [Deltaproteobacteria bacterium]|nr:hypothetical protein [Deltaproteobacteria bacterium]HCH66555.1 hypothetical protein [Deltaproteobacteria bacterium]